MNWSSRYQNMIDKIPAKIVQILGSSYSSAPPLIALQGLISLTTSYDAIFARQTSGFFIIDIVKIGQFYFPADQYKLRQLEIPDEEGTERRMS